MNPIASKIDGLIKQYEELEKLNTGSNKDLSDIDLELSNWYHRVEGMPVTITAYKAHKLMKEGKDILERRRNVKLEGILLRSTCDLLRDKIGAVKGTTKKTLIKDSEVRKEIIDRADEQYKTK